MVRDRKAKGGKFDKIGVIDSHGSEIVPFWYASIVHFSEKSGELALRKKKYSFEDNPDGIDVWSLKTGRRVSVFDCTLLPAMSRKNMLRLLWSLLVLAGLHVAMISPWSLFHLWTQLPLALKIGYVAISCVLFFILVGKILNEQLDSTDGYDLDCRYDYYPTLPLAAAYGLVLLIMLPKLSVVLTVLRILGYVVCAVLLTVSVVRLFSVCRTFRLTRKSLRLY